MAMIHISRDATSLGAFPEEQVREGLRSGRFGPSDLGWREGMANWQPLSQFPEFAADIAAAAAVPPPQIGPISTSTLPPAGATWEAPGPRSGLPWDQRQQKGLFSAFIETLQMVLSKPTAAFTAMKREGGLGEPLIYAIIGGTFGTVFAVIYNFVLRSFPLFANRQADLAHLIGGLGWIAILILAPVLVAIATFISSAIFHLCLMMMGGAKQSFETTFRVICFAGGSINPLLVIPFCGGLIVGIWKIVLYCIGLARAHETDTGRATLAVLLPVIVCCGGLIFLAVLIPALTLGFHGANR
jgi:hypothetical protein